MPDAQESSVNPEAVAAAETVMFVPTVKLGASFTGITVIVTEAVGRSSYRVRRAA